MLAVIERFAKTRNRPLQRLQRGRRRPLAPELVDQLVSRNGLIGMQHQDREQRTLFLPAQFDDRITNVHLERAENSIRVRVS
jgi:hypothetical protein